MESAVVGRGLWRQGQGKRTTGENTWMGSLPTAARYQPDTLYHGWPPAMYASAIACLFTLRPAGGCEL